MLRGVTRQSTTGDTPPARRPTLRTVARDARVSVSTVSKVLNGRAGVSQAKRKTVEEYLERHGYQPRTAPEASRVIEVAFFELGTEWILEVLQGVDKVARELGCRIMLTPSKDLHDVDRAWIEELIERPPMGVILLFSSLSAADKRQLRNRSIPFVVVDPAGEPEADVSYVGSRNWAGGLAAGQHLLSLGHSDIAMIAGPEDQMCSRARMSGFRSAFEMAGVPFREDLVRWGHFHSEDGTALARELLDLDEPPTAIFAGADLQAVGVYEAARERGLDIPKDLSVVGYDDLPVSRLMWPPLTTIRQPIRAMAETAARLVTNLLPTEVQHIDLATKLVVRESTGVPARRRAVAKAR